MTKAESEIRAILGPIRGDSRPLAYAVDATIELLFVQHISMDDIQVTKQIYPMVAQRLSQHPSASCSERAVSRRVERLANLCWDTIVAQNMVEKYLGDAGRQIGAPRDLIFYLAYYIYWDKPFFQLIRDRPDLVY